MAQTSFDKSTNEDTTIPDAFKWMWNNPKKVGMTALEMTPIVGDAIAAKEIFNELQKADPNYYLIGALGGATLIGIIPGLGDAVSATIKAGAKKAVDIAKRVEVDPNTLGMNFGNVSIRPRTQKEEFIKLVQDQKNKDDYVWVTHGGKNFDGPLNLQKAGTGEPLSLRPLGMGIYGTLLDPNNTTSIKDAFEQAHHFAAKFGPFRTHTFEDPYPNSTARIFETFQKGGDSEKVYDKFWKGYSDPLYEKAFSPNISTEDSIELLQKVYSKYPERILLEEWHSGGIHLLKIKKDKIKRINTKGHESRRSKENIGAKQLDDLVSSLPNLQDPKAKYGKTSWYSDKELRNLRETGFDDTKAQFVTELLGSADRPNIEVAMLDPSIVEKVAKYEPWGISDKWKYDPDKIYLPKSAKEIDDFRGGTFPENTWNQVPKQTRVFEEFKISSIPSSEQYYINKRPLGSWEKILTPEETILQYPKEKESVEFLFQEQRKKESLELANRLREQKRINEATEKLEKNYPSGAGTDTEEMQLKALGKATDGIEYLRQNIGPTTWTPKSKPFNKGGLGTAQTKYPSTAYLNPDLQQSTAIPDAIGSAVKWLFPSDKKEELSDVEKYVGDPRLLERGRPAPVEASQYDASKYGPEDVTRFLYEFSPAYAPEAARLAKEYGGKEGFANKAMGWLHAFDAATALIPVAGGASRKMVTDPAKFVLKRDIDTTALANKKSDYKGVLKEFVSNQKSINKFFRNNDSRIGIMFNDEATAFKWAILGKEYRSIPMENNSTTNYFNKNLGRHQKTLLDPLYDLEAKQLLSSVTSYDGIVNEIKKVRQSLMKKGYSEDELNNWAKKANSMASAPVLVSTHDIEGRRRILLDTIDEEPLLKEYEKLIEVSNSIYTARKDYLKVLQDRVDLIESDVSKGIDFNDARRNFEDEDLYAFMELGYIDQDAPWEDLTSFWSNKLGKHASDIRDIRTHLNTNYSLDIDLLGKELDVKYNKNAEEIVDSFYNKTAKYIGPETGKPIFNSITQFIEELPDDMSASEIMDLLEKNKNSFPKSQLALFKKYASSGSKLDLLESSKKVGQDFDIKFHPEQKNIGQRISVVNSKSNEGYGITIHSDSAKKDFNLSEYEKKFQHFGGTRTGNLGHSRGAVIEAPLDGEMQKFILIEEFQSDTLKNLDIDITANKTTLKKRKEELEDFYSRRPSAIDTPNVVDKKTIEDYEKQIKFLNDKIAELTEIKKTFPSHEEYIYQQLLGHIKYASENGIDKIVIPKLTGESTVKNLYKKLNDFIIQRPKVEEPDFRNLVEKDILEETALLQGMSRDQKNIYDKAIKADDDFVNALTYGKVDTKLFEDYPQLRKLPKYFWHDFLKNTSKQIELTSSLGDKKILGINDTEIERLLAKSWTTNGEIVREALGPEASISLLTKMLAEHHPHVTMRGAGGGLKPDSALKIYEEGLNNAIKRLLQKEKFPVTETTLPEGRHPKAKGFKTELTHNIRRYDSHLDIQGGSIALLGRDVISPSTSDVIILDLSSFLQKYDPATDALRFNKGGLAMEKQMELAFMQ